MNMIGFDRFLQKDWMDAAALTVENGNSVDEARSFLHDYLKDPCPKYEARKKSITVLTKIWIRIPDSLIPLRDEAICLMPHLSDEERIWLHWGMCLNAYPFFSDVIKAIGRYNDLYGIFEKREIVNFMAKNWGERTTIPRAVQRIVDSLLEWGAIVRMDTPGKFQCLKNYSTHNKTLELWLLKSVISSNKRNSYPLNNIGSISEAFPFQFTIAVSDVLLSDQFSIITESNESQIFNLNKY